MPGWLASKVRRDRILRAYGCIALCAIAAMVSAILASTFKFQRLCGALALWGVVGGAGPVLDALLADSTPNGSRSKVRGVERRRNHTNRDG